MAQARFKLDPIFPFGGETHACDYVSLIAPTALMLWWCDDMFVGLVMMSKTMRSAFLGNGFPKTLKNLCKGRLTKIFFGLICQTCFTHSAISRGAVNG